MRAAGIHTVQDLLHRVETAERSDIWIYVSCDRDDDGELKLVNASGFYPDELTAGLAGETYVRNWKEKMDDDPPPETFPVPLFIEEPRAGA
jgi:hypothetical protein